MINLILKILLMPFKLLWILLIKLPLKFIKFIFIKVPGKIIKLFFGGIFLVVLLVLAIWLSIRYLT